MEYIETDFTDALIESLCEEDIDCLIEQYNQLTPEQQVEGFVTGLF